MKLYSKYDAISKDQTVQYLWRMHKSFINGKKESFAELNTSLYSKYKESLSNEIKWDIVIVNIPLIFEMVHKKWDNRFEFSDLLQEGLLGASIGVEKYREGSGSTLVTIIRMYTFKMIQKYIDKYSHRAIVHSEQIAKQLSKEKNQDDTAIDGLFTSVSNGHIQDTSTILLVTPDQRQSKLLLDFIDNSFDNMTQDIFYAHFHIPKRGKTQKKKVQSFEETCLHYEMTPDEGRELALITHSTIKKHYDGIYKDSF